MSTKIRDKLWGISLIVIGISTLVLVIPDIVGFELPVILARILGVIELVSLIVLSFTTVRRLIDKKELRK